MQSGKIAVEVILGNQLDRLGMILLDWNVFAALLDVFKLESGFVSTVFNDYFNGL